MGSDQAVLPTARLAERLGLPGLPLETARTVADKRRMRKAFDKATRAVPARSRGERLRGGRAGVPRARRAGRGQAGRRLGAAGRDRGAGRRRAGARVRPGARGVTNRSGRARAVPRRRRVHGERLPARRRVLPDERHPPAAPSAAAARRLHLAPLPVAAAERGRAVRAGARHEPRGRPGDRAFLRPGPRPGRRALGHRSRRTARRRQGRRARQARDRLRRRPGERALGARRAVGRGPRARASPSRAAARSASSSPSRAGSSASTQRRPWRSTASTRPASTGARG